MAAVAAVRAGRVQAPEVTVAWLVGVARHKLADHWRRSAREERGIAAVAVLSEEAGAPWDKPLAAQGAHAALALLAGPQRAALTLRCLAWLPAAAVAACVSRRWYATAPLPET